MSKQNIKLLNIKTENNTFYLYNIDLKQFFSSDFITYSILEYIEYNDLDISDTCTKYLAVKTGFPKRKVDSVIKRINYLESANCNNITSGITSKINKEIIYDSFSNIKQIIIEITEKCNLKCHYCTYGLFYKETSKREKNININDCISALDKLLSIYILHSNKSIIKRLYISFYGGEPLLNIDSIKLIVNHMKRYDMDNVKFIYSMTTNGILLDETIDFLQKENFYISISLDGNKENNAYRKKQNGNETFEKINANIETIRNKYPKYFKNNVNFISVLHRKNDIISINNFFSKLNKKSTIVNLSTDNLEDSRKDEFYTIYNQGKLNAEEMNQLVTVDYDMYKDIIDYVYDINDDLFSMKHHWNIWGKENMLERSIIRGCYLFASKIFLSADGYIYPCEKVNRNFPFGSYKDNELLFFDNKIQDYYDYLMDIQNSQCMGCCIENNCEICYFSDPDNFIDEKPKCYQTRENYSRLLAEKISKNELSVTNNHKTLRIEPYVYVNRKNSFYIFYNTFDGSFLEYDFIHCNTTVENNVLEISNCISDQDLKFIKKLEKNNIAYQIGDNSHTFSVDLFKKIENEFFAMKNKSLSKEDLLLTCLKQITILPNQIEESSDELSHKSKQFEIFSNINSGCKGLDLMHLENYFNHISLENIHVNIGLNKYYKNDHIEKLLFIIRKSKDINLHMSYNDYVNIFRYSSIVRNNKITIMCNSTDNFEYDFLSERSKENTTINIYFSKKYSNNIYRKVGDKLNIKSFPYYSNNQTYLYKILSYTKNDIFKNKKDFFKLIRNKILNEFLFGKITLHNDGNIYSNITTGKIGNIANTSITDTLSFLESDNNSWFLSRDKFKPCCNCIYRDLCPSVSYIELYSGCTFCKKFGI